MSQRPETPPATVPVPSRSSLAATTCHSISPCISPVFIAICTHPGEMSKLRPPRPVLEIANRLESAGFEVWCVGGAVRDALLGHPDLDWDLATSATPPQVRELFGSRRTIPKGIEFGTVGVLDRYGTLHEVTTFRRDVRTDGRHAVVEFGVSLEDDL